MPISERERKLIEEAIRLLEDCHEEDELQEIKKDTENQKGARYLLRRLRRMGGV